MKEELENLKVEVNDIIIEGGKIEFDSLLLNISQIIVREAEKKSRIHINISASGKIAAATASIAGMYHADKIGRMYYVIPSSYSVAEEKAKEIFMDHGFSIGLKDIYYPPYFKIEKPKPKSLFVLTYLYENGPQHYKSLIYALMKENFKPFNDAEIPTGQSPSAKSAAKKEINKWTMKLKRLVLDGLLQQDYIKLKPSYEGGKRLVNLTKNGKYAAILSGKITELRDFP